MTDDPIIDPDPTIRVHGGDCLTVLRTLPDNSVHAVVTDPPYGLSQLDSAKLTTALTAWVNGDRERVPSGKGFMGKEWDAFVPPPAVWDECLRVLKPGGHALVFAGSRTVDLMGLSIRLAGFEIRDTLQWLTAAGFPKSMDVSKALDKAAGATREVVGAGPYAARRPRGIEQGTTFADDSYEWGAGHDITAPATDAAREWSGWGTALKPAAEPIILARKPLASTVARNVLAHGTGGLNIDGCRVGMSDADRDRLTKWHAKYGGFEYAESGTASGKGLGAIQPPAAGGRFPANVILSHTETCTDDVCDEGCPVAELDAQSGITKDGVAVHRNRPGGTYQAPSAFGTYGNDARADIGYSGSGGASRFFASFRYQAKAPKSERPKVNGVSHNTVKPLALMRWLVRLVTPPGGTILDPFAGTGTTLQAAREEGFHSIGIEREADYWPLIEHRTGVTVEQFVEPVEPEPVEPEPVEPEPVEPEPVEPEPVEPEPVEPEPVEPADTAELDAVVNKILAVVDNPAFGRLPELDELARRAAAAETVAVAEVVRDELRAVLTAARNGTAA